MPKKRHPCQTLSRAQYLHRASGAQKSSPYLYSCGSKEQRGDPQKRDPSLMVPRLNDSKGKEIAPEQFFSWSGPTRGCVSALGGT